MPQRSTLLSVIAVFLLFSLAHAQEVTKQAPQALDAKHRNVIIFVADGLRHGSVNEKDTPTLYAVRTQGVHFENSYSIFPTLTTANASVIATGHRLGDTGDFSNSLYTGFPTFDTGNFNRKPGTTIPFVENDFILADLNSHMGGNYLNETTLLEAARNSGFNTAAIGKLGPTAIQDISELKPKEQQLAGPQTIIIDDSTAHNPYDPAKPVPTSIPMPSALVERLVKAGLPVAAPGRSNGYGTTSAYNNGNSGDINRPGTLRANTVQQDWFIDVATQAVLPMFAGSGKPFVLLFWSRDPDGTQHNQGDSFKRLTPGINGHTSRSAAQNADRALQRILQWLDEHPEIKANTDIFVTSDHGFNTVSRRELDRDGNGTTSEAAKHTYRNSTGQLDTPKGALPLGFLAVDLAWGLHTKLWDPSVSEPASSVNAYREIRLATDTAQNPVEDWEHPSHGSAFLGDTVTRAAGSDALAIVAAGGGSDLIYVPDQNPRTVQRIVKLLTGFDYVDGIFVDDRYGQLPGTLPLSAIDLVGTAVMPRPAIVVAFKVFYLKTGDPMQAVQISDTSLQEGQGNHGGFGRDCTWNNMAAVGPDFKQGYVDRAPVSNSDIVPTLASILGLNMSSNGKLRGRVLDEAIKGRPDAKVPATSSVVSTPVPGSNRRTVLFIQQFDGQKYFDSACMTTDSKVEPGMCMMR